MTQIAALIKQCPNCNYEFATWGYISYSTFCGKRDTLYTDGFKSWSLFNESSAVLICPGCNKYLWQEDLPTKEYIIDSNPDSFPHSRPIQLSDYEYILHHALWGTNAQEKQIRIRLWWTFNNVYRVNNIKRAKVLRESEEVYKDMVRIKSKLELPKNEMAGDLLELERIRAWFSFNYSDRDCTSEKFNLPPEQEANLRRLLQVLDTNEPTETIMKAEILRELGQFDQCLKQLNQSFDDMYMPAVSAIKKLATRKTRRAKTIK